MNKKIVLTAVLVTVLGTGVFGISSVSAQSTVDPSATIVSKIAEKFGLNKEEVRKVFDEERTARRAEMQARMEERLNALVTEGKLTEAQKQLLIAKHKEMQAERESSRKNMETLTPQERRSAMEGKREELQTWAKENGIDEQYLFFGQGMKGFGRGRMDPRLIE